MQIAYVTNIRFPTEKAHGYQIAKMCEAFLQSADVKLIYPTRATSIKDNPFIYYGVEQFNIRQVGIIDCFKFFRGKTSFFLNSAQFFIRCAFLSFQPQTLIYTRTPELAWLFAVRRFKTIFECHQLPDKKSSLYSKLVKKASGIVAITQGLKDDLAEKFNYPKDKILVAPDAVDLKTFDLNLSKREARERLGLPQEKNILVYTGQLFSWKGVNVLAQASKKLADTELYLVGGTKDDIQNYRDKNNPAFNLKNVPFRPRAEIALWLKAADMLILPNSAKEQISERYTSPLKLFEYMASGTPIVASDLPSIREILDEESAYFFKPDNPDSLVDQIQKYLNDPRAHEKISNKAHEKSRLYTWTARAEKIMEFISRKN